MTRGKEKSRKEAGLHPWNRQSITSSSFTTWWAVATERNERYITQRLDGIAQIACPPSTSSLGAHSWRGSSYLQSPTMQHFTAHEVDVPLKTAEALPLTPTLPHADLHLHSHASTITLE